MDGCGAINWIRGCARRSRNASLIPFATRASYPPVSELQAAPNLDHPSPALFPAEIAILLAANYSRPRYINGAARVAKVRMVEEVSARPHEVKMQPFGESEALPNGQIIRIQARSFQDVNAGIAKPSDVGGI